MSDKSDKQYRLGQWLRDAHAMEQQAETMLKAQASRLENYPELRQRIERHITETQSQAKRLQECIDRVGTSPSAMKDAGGRMMAMMQGLGGVFAGDEVVKGAMAGYAFEHFEISAYSALIGAAESAGDTATAGICREIMREEEEMAGWLKEHLPKVTSQFLERESSGETAKR